MHIKVTDISFAFANTKREVFERLFPDGADLTVENARRATEAGLSLRCVADQLMGSDALAGFQRRANGLLAIYMENTAETRESVRSFKLNADRVGWMEADALHSANKDTHWSAYLDGLATAFVGELKGAA